MVKGVFKWKNIGSCDAIQIVTPIREVPSLPQGPPWPYAQVKESRCNLWLCFLSRMRSRWTLKSSMASGFMFCVLNGSMKSGMRTGKEGLKTLGDLSPMRMSWVPTCVERITVLHSRWILQGQKFFHADLSARSDELNEIGKLTCLIKIVGPCEFLLRVIFHLNPTLSPHAFPLPLQTYQGEKFLFKNFFG